MVLLSYLSIWGRNNTRTHTPHGHQSTWHATRTHIHVIVEVLHVLDGWLYMTWNGNGMYGCNAMVGWFYLYYEGDPMCCLFGFTCPFGTGCACTRECHVSS